MADCLFSRPHRSRLKAKNLMYINQLLHILSSFINVMQSKAPLSLPLPPPPSLSISLSPSPPPPHPSLHSPSFTSVQLISQEAVVSGMEEPREKEEESMRQSC